MTMPDPYEILGELTDDRSRFAGRPDYPDPVGVITRLLRFLGGNPITDVSVTSTGSGNVKILPDVAAAQSCMIQVISGVIIFSEGGSAPTVAGSQTAAQGAWLTLTGMETIKGFQFASANTSGAVISATYYD